jgi:predicted MarR family transcription regulator
MEERIRNSVGMLLNTRWVVAYLAKTCSHKLAFLETFIIFQLRKEERSSLISEIKRAKCQEEKR